MSPKNSPGLSDDEKLAMKERLKELKADKADGETMVMEKINEMSEPGRTMALRLHTLIKSNAPTLTPKTWYGMPAYATSEGKVVCFFQDAAKFKARYATLGFSDVARLDDGDFWPTSFALNKLTPTEEAQIIALVKKAVG